MEIKEKLVKLIENYTVFSEDIQKKVGRDRAVTYVVGIFEINKVEATFQRVCFLAFKLFPESFSFSEFPEYPDSRVVRNCLWHCVHKNKGWLIGSDKTYYNLTEKGKEILQIFMKLIKNKMDPKSLPYELQIKGVTKKALVTKSHDKEINFLKEIEESDGFKFYLDKKDVSAIDVRKSLGGDRYSSQVYLNNNFLRALEISNTYKNKSVKSYLIWIKRNWNRLIGD